MTAWAIDEDGEQVIPAPSQPIPVEHIGSTSARVTVRIINPAEITNDDYEIHVGENAAGSSVWHLYNATQGSFVITDRPVWIPDTVSGLEIRVDGVPLFTSFEVVANAAGALDPPEPGAFWFGDFPVPRVYDPNGYITDRQQVTYPGGQWGFHTADNGGTGVGTRGSYAAFLSRVLRDGFNTEALGQYDYEMRFTGSYDNPEVGGSYAIEPFLDDNVFWVPFELWQIGVGTPDEESDDVRLIPFIVDDGNDNTYNLESYGTSLDGTCHADCEHSVSGLYDDPFTDWVYWICPVNDAPGSAGYDAAEDDMIAGTFMANYYDHVGYEIMARTVLVNWNGGQEPAFTQNLPEQGTVFRILTRKEAPVEPDAFTFTGEAMPTITTGDEGTSIYLRYLITN